MNHFRGRDGYGPPKRDMYRPGPGLDDMLRRGPIGDDLYNDPLLRGLDPLSVQAQVIVIDPERRCRDYAEMFLSKLKRTGLICDIVILDKFTSPSQVIDDATASGLLYTASVNLQNERHQSITINILQGQPQEHRNMPYEDALKLVSRNFDAHLLKLAGSKPDQAVSQPGITEKDKIEEIDPTLSLLLINLAEGKNLRLADLDKVIGFLNKKRDKLTGSSSPKHPIPTTYQNQQSKSSNAPKPVQPPSSSSAPTVSTPQAEKLQAKITQLFGDRNKQQSTVKPAVASVNAPAQSNNASSYSTTSTSSDQKGKSVGIDFNNPTVQNALQNLMRTGPNILNSIRSTSESSASADAPKAENRYDSDDDDYKDRSRPAKRAKPGRHAIAGFY